MAQENKPFSTWQPLQESEASRLQKFEELAQQINPPGRPLDGMTEPEYQEYVNKTMSMLHDQVEKTGQPIQFAFEADNGQTYKLSITYESEYAKQTPPNEKWQSVEQTRKDNIEKQVEETASKNIKALSATLSDMIKDTKRELIMTQNELDKSIDNLQKMDQELATSLRSGQDVSWAHNEDREALLETIQDQQAKIQDLQPKLDSMYSLQAEYSKEMRSEYMEAIQSGLSDVADKTKTYLTEGIRAVKDTFIQIGTMAAEKNEQFQNGVKTAMLDVGDKAQQIYVKGMEKLQEIGTKFRESLENSKDWVKTQTNKGIDFVKSIPERYNERGKSIKMDSLADRLQKAETRRAHLEQRGPEGKNPLVNTLYNLSLDHSKSVAEKTMDYLNKETQRLSDREGAGKFVDPKYKDFLKEAKEFVTQKIETLTQSAPMTREMPTLQDR